MKGDKFLNIVVILLAVAVLGYLVISLIPDSDSSFTTYKAVRYEVGGLSTSGFVVRSEQPIPGVGGQIVVLTRKEGEWVSKGQAVASTFRDNSARERQNQIEKLETELSQMEAAYDFASSGRDSTGLDADIIRLMNQVSVYNNRGERAFAESAAEELKANVLRRYLNSDESKLLWNRITETKETLNNLYAEASAESGTVNAPAAGYFSAEADGYESVLTPEMLSTITVSQLSSIKPDAASVSGAIGKLVTSQQWFYITKVATKDAAGLKQGDAVDVRFVYDFYQAVRMRVTRISPSENGQCLVVLSSEQFVHNAVTTRKQSADIVQQEKTGLLVPKAAIYGDGTGKSCVYVLEGEMAHQKTVEIIKDVGDQYLVRLDQSSIDNLWPDDEVILTKEEMFDGKVMMK